MEGEETGNQEKEGMSKTSRKEPRKRSEEGGVGGGRLGEEQEGGALGAGSGERGDRKCCAGWITVSLSSGMV